MTQEMNVVEIIAKANSEITKTQQYRCNVNEVTYTIVIPDDVKEYLIDKAGCKARDYFLNNYFVDVKNALQMFYIDFHIGAPDEENCCYQCGNLSGKENLTFGLCEECAREELGDELFNNFKGQ